MNVSKTQRNSLGSKISGIGFYLLLFTIFFSAIPNGTADDWVASTVVTMICICAVVRIFESLILGNFEFAEPLLLLPLIGVLLLGLTQLSLSVFTPNSAAANWLGTTNNYETQKFLVLFFGLTITLEMLFHYVKTRRRLVALVVLVMVVGVGSAAFGILKLAFPIGESTGLQFVIGKQSTFAQFINRNHFAFLMEMSLGLFVGLLIKGRLKDQFKLIIGVSALLVLFAAILSNSRGAILSMLGLGLFFVFGFFVVKRRSADETLSDSSQSGVFGARLKMVGIPLAFALLFVGLGALTVAFVGGDPVVSRLESLKGEIREVDDQELQRSQIWSDTWKLIKVRPVTGFGFGAYGTAITSVDGSTGERSLQQAHNDYLQVLADAGIAGFGLLSVFIVLVSIRVKEQFKVRSSFRKAASFGAAAGIFGIMLHSFVDFGLHTVVNALILLVLVVIGTARISSHKGVLAN